MEVLKKLKCALTSKKPLERYYAELSSEELIKRKAYHLKVYLLTSLCWVFSFVIIIWAAKMDAPILILYTGTIIGVLITLWADYRKKVKLIDDLIK